MESAVLYFDKPGKGNTAAALAAGVKRAKELGLRHAVVASASGETALAFHAEAKRQGWAGALVCVTHHVGFAVPGEDEMGGKMRERLRGLGFAVVTGTHALSGPERSFRLKFKGISPLEIIAETLRLFGQGVKVCVEIAVMTCDAGAVPAGRDALFIGGTGEGADAVCVIAPAGQSAFLELKAREIVCKPR